MEKPLSSYWKKREPHKKFNTKLDYVDEPVVIWGRDNDMPLIEKSHIYEGHITPTRVIENKNAYEITYLDPMFILNGFMVTTQQDFVQHIYLFGHHPNRDLDTNLYCLPDYKKGVKYDEQYFQMLLTNIKTYYLDSCYFRPGDDQMHTKKLKSIYMKMNKEE